MHFKDAVVCHRQWLDLEDTVSHSPRLNARLYPIVCGAQVLRSVVIRRLEHGGGKSGKDGVPPLTDECASGMISGAVRLIWQPDRYVDADRGGIGPRGDELRGFARSLRGLESPIAECYPKPTRP